MARWVHVDRIAGGYCHHRHFGRHALAGVERRQETRARTSMYEQHEPAHIGLSVGLRGETTPARNMTYFCFSISSIRTALVLVVLVPLGSAWGLTNVLALTPPMGWNSWNHFQCNIDETIIKSMADVMATNGMRVAGYQFINIDDCWQANRDSNGVIVADPTRFPGGIKALADYVHSKGLKLGIYSDHGTSTCQGKPGSYGYEYLDALTYASWGVDYLKYDNCNLPSGDSTNVD